jgi:hypothetical protein
VIGSDSDSPVRWIPAALALAVALASGCGSGAAVCSPSCAGKACGADGCGGSCGSCTSGQSCDSSGSCAEDWCGAGSISCGDGTTCPVNSTCGPAGCVCIDGDAMVSCAGEGCTSSGNCARHAEQCVQAWCGSPSVKCSDGSICPARSVCDGKSCDCPAANGVWQNCNGQPCDATFSNCGGVGWKCAPLCAPQCSGKSCGPDGCGGTCGSCAGGQTCDGSGNCSITNQCYQGVGFGCVANSCCFGQCRQQGANGFVDCTPGNTYCVCTAFPGEACKIDSDCADSNCSGGVCVCLPNGPRRLDVVGAHGGNYCCSKVQDTLNSCCNSPGTGCQSDIDCCDGATCDLATHKCGCVPNDRDVFSSSECCSGLALLPSAPDDGLSATSDPAA